MQFIIEYIKNAKAYKLPNGHIYSSYIYYAVRVT